MGLSNLITLYVSRPWCW